MYPITKKYYSNYSSNDLNDTISNSFLVQANLLLSLYYKNDIVRFNSYYVKFNRLLIRYPNYKYNSSYKVLVKLVQTINILYNLGIDLKKQITLYENSLVPMYSTKPGIEFQELSISQDTSIDLVYLQYLLLLFGHHNKSSIYSRRNTTIWIF